MIAWKDCTLEEQRDRMKENIEELERIAEDADAAAMEAEDEATEAHEDVVREERALRNHTAWTESPR